jgi:hypothetical protein
MAWRIHPSLARHPCMIAGIQLNTVRMSIFDEKYRVVAIQGDQLVIRGEVSGEVLTIINPEPATPLTHEDYPPGKLITLSDHSAAPLN